MQQFSCRYVFQVGRDLPAVHRADRGTPCYGGLPTKSAKLNSTTSPPPHVPQVSVRGRYLMRLGPSILLLLL